MDVMYFCVSSALTVEVCGWLLLSMWWFHGCDVFLCTFSSYCGGMWLAAFVNVVVSWM